MTIRAATDRDRSWMRIILKERWGSPEIVTRGRLHRADQLAGFIAWDQERPVGLVTCTLADGDCEIVSLDSLESGRGIGTSLVTAVSDLAFARRIWLVTTNDNTGALQFYRKVGFERVAIHRAAVKESRRIKPGIPEIGWGGIPIRDEVELELKMQ